MGSIHHLIRYIPNLAQTAADLHPMLKNTEKIKPNNWTPEHYKAFSSIKKLVSTITQKNILINIWISSWYAKPPRQV